MPRVKLTDEEREAKRRERARRSFSDESYKHYDTSEGFGRPEDWIAAAELLAEGVTFATPGASNLNPLDRRALATLGLLDLPPEMAELKKVFRRRCFETHPDYGGSGEEFKAVYAAFERLVKHYT